MANTSFPKQSRQFSLGKIRIKNAFNPILYLVVVVGIVVSMAFNAGVDEKFIWAILGLFFFVIVAACWAYFYFMIKDPDRLHSEEFQLKKHTLEMEHGMGLIPHSVDGPLGGNPHIIEGNTEGAIK